MTCEACSDWSKQLDDIQTDRYNIMLLWKYGCPVIVSPSLQLQASVIGPKIEQGRKKIAVTGYHRNLSKLSEEPL